MKLRTKIIQSLIHINEAIFFYPKLKKFYKDNLKNASVSILDVGANKGQSIDFFLGINPNAKITAFEPNKKLFQLLQEKYKNNGNISLNNLGVSNTNGELEFNENILDETSSFESLNLDSKYLEKKAKVLGVTKESIIVDKYKVAVISLSEFLKSNESSSFDVLKIDVEGHELTVLEGLFSKGNQFKIRLIQLESHNDDMYLSNSKHQDIDQLLNKNGYFEVAKIKHGFGDFAEIIYENKDK
jgi:FkbM family methyltransferase